LVLSLAPDWMANPTNAARTALLTTGAVVKISTVIAPDMTGVKTAISGGSVLIRNGRKEAIVVPKTDAYKFRSVNERHPRSAIGANRDFLFFVQVDGRQPGFSMGMTLAELADYM